MGLLAVLDFHKTFDKNKIQRLQYSEIEFRLQSWGAMYLSVEAGIMGRKALQARYILHDFPIKLFSMTKLHENDLPQQICLTFRATYEDRIKKENYSLSGIFHDEIAKETAAFLSLITRRRIFAVGLIRYDDFPIDEPAEMYGRSHYQEQQKEKEISPPEIQRLLEKLQGMNRHLAETFILSTRLYHSAVEMMFTEPEFSYLFLIASLEAISSVVYEDYKPHGNGNTNTELEQFLEGRFPGWKQLNDYSQNKDKLINVLLSNEHFTFRKLLKFVEEYLPEKFWEETEDDAKPWTVKREIVSGERFEKKNLKQVLRRIYDGRSSFLHKGERFPKCIVIGHSSYIPIEARFEDLLEFPGLITFERLVSYSLVNFLAKQS